MLRSLLSFIAYAIVVFYAIACLGPWAPQFLNGDDLRDPSWQMALNHAYAEGWEFGSEIVFTYGPYGFLHPRVYHPETYIALAVFWTLFAVVFADSCWSLATSAVQQPIIRAGVILVLVNLAARSTMAALFSIQLIFLLEYFSRTDCWWTNEQRIRLAWLARSQSVDLDETSFHSRFRWMALVLIVATLPLIKLTYLATAGLLVAVLGFESLSRRKLPTTAIALPLVTVGLWVAAGQPYSGLESYLQNGLQIVSGYTAAMSTWESEWLQWATIGVAALLVVALPLCILASFPDSGRETARMILAGTVLAMMFVIFKSAFVRFHIGKVCIFTCSATLFTGMLWLTLGGLRRGMDGRWVALTSGTLIFLFTTEALFVGSQVPKASIAPGSHTTSTATAFASLNGTISYFAMPAFHKVRDLHRTVTGPDWLAAEHETRREKVRAENPIPPVTGTCDVMPHKLVTLFGQQCDYQPRPIIQSYSVYTPTLAELNAAHFGSPQAPESILFEVDPLDQRFPTLGDSLAWLEILGRYELTEQRGDVFLLRKSSQPREYQQDSLSESKAKWNEAISIPASPSGLVWCRLRIERTDLGQLAEMLFKLPPVWLHVTCNDGKERTYRLIPAMAETGFLLSPLVENTAMFAVLMPRGGFTRNWGRQRGLNVTSLRLTIEDGFQKAQFYEDVIEVEFDQIRFR